MHAWEWALEYLACPVCRQPLEVLSVSQDRRDAVLAHHDGSCEECYPVIGGIPRIVVGEARAKVRATHHAWFASPFGESFAHWQSGESSRADLALVDRFDVEWRTFSEVGTDEQERLFARYFDLVPVEAISSGSVALDAGCGAGRWADQVRRRGARVIALDLGESIQLAESNTRASGLVACVQGDVRRLPVREGAFDLVYSLGVLHHIPETDEALSALAKRVRKDGWLLVYLYYALENRSAIYRLLFRIVDVSRRGISQLPQSQAQRIAAFVATFIYWPLARLSRVLHALGMAGAARRLPLGFYAFSSFQTMRNDSLDRLGTKLEKRYRRDEVDALLAKAGIDQIEIATQEPYWHAVGRRA